MADLFVMPADVDALMREMRAALVAHARMPRPLCDIVGAYWRPGMLYDFFIDCVTAGEVVWDGDRSYTCGGWRVSYGYWRGAFEIWIDSNLNGVTWDINSADPFWEYLVGNVDFMASAINDSIGTPRPSKALDVEIWRELRRDLLWRATMHWVRARQM